MPLHWFFVLSYKHSMQIIPIKTRILTPPQDDLFAVLDESLTDVVEGDIVVVTSKVVSIHEGRCVSIEGTEKETLIRGGAEYVFEQQNDRKPLTLVHNALISSSGIDESNGQGYYILLPEKPFDSAREIHTYLTKKFNLKNCGVIITDSHSLPLRYGAMSISIGCWGFVPVEDHKGREDLFGRIMKYSSMNIADSIAAASNLVSGECDESQPVVIARGVPNVVFTEDDMSSELFVPLEDDLYKILFKDFKKRE